MKPLPAADLDHILAHAPFEELRGARLFITGGTGFFGIWLLESLCHANARLDLGVQAVVLSRDPQKFLDSAPHLAQNPTLSFARGDVRDFDFPGGAFSHIIHAATEASATLNAQSPLEMFDVCAQGTRRALDFARHCGAKRFLLVSSGAVYGPQPPEISHLSEDYRGAPDPLDPNAAYAHGKRASEWLGAVYNANFAIEVVTARCFAFIGPHLPLDAHFAAGNFIRDALNGGPIRVGGDGTPFRSYLYAADLAIWLWTMLIFGKSGQAYNVGSDEAISIRKLAELTARGIDKDFSVEIARPSVEGQLPPRYVSNTEKARRDLGLQIYIPLVDSLRRTIGWHRMEGISK